LRGYARMSESGEKKILVPKLRFPEFSDAWNAAPLDHVADVNPPTMSGLPEQFRYIDLESVENGTLLQSREEHRATAPSRAQRIVAFDDILFQTVRPYQKNNLLFSVDDRNVYVASTGYAQIRAHSSAAFLYHLLEAEGFQRGVQRRCSGSNYPAIAPSDLANIVVPWPSSSEQRKIAECLQSLDESIAAETEKLEALKRHKKGLLQQLFPAEGETTPRLRFRQFRNDTEWSMQPLASLCSIKTGKKDVNEGSAAGVYPFFTCAAAVSRSDSFSFDTEAVLIAGNADSVGRAKYYKGKFEAYQRTYVLDAFRNVTARYAFVTLDAWFQTFVRSQVQTTAMNYITLPILSNFPMPMPASESEQETIAQFNFDLSEMIELQLVRLANLRTHKAALMQQLFPEVDEMEA